MLPTLAAALTSTFDIKKAVHIKTEVVDIFLKVKKLKIESLKYDQEKTMVDLFEANNTFGAHLIDSSFNFTLEYGLALDPAILKDEGHFEVFSEGLDFNAFFHPVEEELNGEKSVVIKVHDV